MESLTGSCDQTLEHLGLLDSHVITLKCYIQDHDLFVFVTLSMLGCQYVYRYFVSEYKLYICVRKTYVSLILFYS